MTRTVPRSEEEQAREDLETFQRQRGSHAPLITDRLLPRILLPWDRLRADEDILAFRVTITQNLGIAIEVVPSIPIPASDGDMSLPEMAEVLQMVALRGEVAGGPVVRTQDQHMVDILWALIAGSSGVSVWVHADERGECGLLIAVYCSRLTAQGLPPVECDSQTFWSSRAVRVLCINRAYDTAIRCQARALSLAGGFRARNLLVPGVRRLEEDVATGATDGIQVRQVTNMAAERHVSIFQFSYEALRHDAPTVPPHTIDFVHDIDHPHVRGALQLMIVRSVLFSVTKVQVDTYRNVADRSIELALAHYVMQSNVSLERLLTTRSRLAVLRNGTFRRKFQNRVAPTLPVVTVQSRRILKIRKHS